MSSFHFTYQTQFPLPSLSLIPLTLPFSLPICSSEGVRPSSLGSQSLAYQVEAGSIPWLCIKGVQVIPPYGMGSKMPAHVPGVGPSATASNLPTTDQVT